MNETSSFHFIANCIAGFSFLNSAMLITLVHVPYAPMWRHLRKCKYYLSLVFLVVGLSCSKSVFFHLGSDKEIIVTSTLITAGIQSLLFACTGITFVNPAWVRKHWIWGNIMIIIGYATLLLGGLLIYRQWFWITALVACVVYFGLLINYQFCFYGEYNRCVNNTDTLTDEYSESRYAWIKRFFIAVSTLGVTAGIAPFMPTTVYDLWMLLAACFYAYVVLRFVNYWSSTAPLVNKVYEAQTSPQYKQEEISVETVDFGPLETALQEWVEEQGFVKNDLVSEEFAQSLGVSISTLRAYFTQKYQMDFRQWRTHLRIEYACSIIKENPSYSYDTIAEMVGICDRSNFTRTFKKITGMTPKDFAAKSKPID